MARVQIATDSQYVTGNLFRAREWKRNGWRNRHGEPRENSDLSKQLLSAHQKCRIRVDFLWVHGKKSPILKRIDKAAKAAAQRGGIETDRGFKPGAVSRSMVKGIATRFNAQGQSIVIRPYRKKVMRSGENKIRFDIFSEETQTYTDSCYAYASPEITMELHRQYHYRVRFNDNPHYPQILEIVEEVPLQAELRNVVRR